MQTTDDVIYISPFGRYWKALKEALAAKASPLLDFFLFILLTFLVSIAGHTFQDVYSTRQLVLTFRNVILEHHDLDRRAVPIMSLQDVSDHEDFWLYLESNLYPILFPDAFQNVNGTWINPIQKDVDRGRLLRFNVILQHVQMRQVRVKAEPCTGIPQRLNVDPIVDGRIGPGLKGATCYPRYSGAKEDQSEFQGVAYRPGELIGVQPRNPLQQRYPSGGFLVELPHNATGFMEKLMSLKSQRWTDRATRAIFVEFAALNPTRDQFISVRILFEFPEQGQASASATVRAYRDRLTHLLVQDALNLGAEFAVYVTAAVNAAREVGRFRAFGWQAYLSSFWNWFSAITLFSLAGSAYFRFFVSRRWNALQNIGTSPKEFDLSDETGTVNVQFDYDHLGENDGLIVKMQAIALVGAWIRSFAFLQFFSKRVDDFVTTLSHSKNNLIAFGAIMGILVISFSIALFTGFGEANLNFATFPSSLLSLIDLMFGNFSSKSLDFQASLLVTTLIVGFFSMLTFMSLSALLAVVNWSTREVHHGKVERETDNLDANLKYRLRVFIVRFLNHPMFSWVSKSWVDEYIKPKVTTQSKMEEALEVEDAEQRMQRQLLVSAKENLRNIVTATTALKKNVKSLQEQFGVGFDETDDEWKESNAWSKMRNLYQQNMFEQLLQAIKIGDLEVVVAIIEDWKQTKASLGGDVQWRDADGFTALHFASLGGDPDMVYTLLEFGGDSNSRNDDGNTCLHLAALTGQLNVCRVLVEDGFAQVEMVNNSKFTPLHLAAYNGHTLVVDYLVKERQADILAASDEGLTPLHLAVMQTHTETVEFIGNNWRPTLDARSNGGESPLHCAILTNQPIPVVKALLQAGSPVAAKMYNSRNAFQIAVEQGSPNAIIRLLQQVLKMGDDYHRAFASLDEGAAGLSLIKFASLGAVEHIQELIENGANIDTCQPGGGTALHAATRRNDSEVVKFLLESGADPTLQDHTKLSPLQISVMLGHFDSYYLIAEVTGRDNFPVDQDGNTVLHLACQHGKSFDIVQNLVQQYGQDPMARNNLEQTCDDIAKHEYHLHYEIYGEEAIDHTLEHREIIDFFASDALQDFDGDEVVAQQQGAVPGQATNAHSGEHAEAVEQASKRMIKFFERIGFPPDRAYGYARLLAENEIDYQGLQFLTDDQLKEMGIMKLGARNKIMNGVKDLRDRVRNESHEVGRRPSQVKTAEGRRASANVADDVPNHNSHEDHDQIQLI